jgi:hypothetical protein
MKSEDIVHVAAGLLILGSVALSSLHHPYWLGLTAFVGLNLFQYGFSRFCPMTVVLKKLGIRSYCDLTQSAD